MYIYIEIKDKKILILFTLTCSFIQEGTKRGYASQIIKQVCTAVGCVPTAAVAISGRHLSTPHSPSTPPPPREQTNDCENMTFPATR